MPQTLEALDETRGTSLDVEAVAKTFGSFTALHDIDLSVQGDELISLLGPSGCGKTTLLRIVAGFVAQDRGQVRFGGTPVDHLRPNRRGVGIVFQNYALFPHMTVRQNVAYGLDAHGWPGIRKAPRIAEMLELVQMSAMADRLPRQLSGGQQQRVALARCLATGPRILLLDEPFGALDKNLREGMQIEVQRLQRSTGITTLMVTHDQEEALSMSDRIAVMNAGRIEQVGTPTELYDRPATAFVNQFLGATNMLEGELLEAGPHASHVRLQCGTVLAAAPAPGLRPGSAVWLSVRPEQIQFHPATTGDGLSGTVSAVLPLGPTIAYELTLPGGARCKATLPRLPGSPAMAIGDTLSLTPRTPESCRLYPLHPPLPGGGGG